MSSCMRKRLKHIYIRNLLDCYRLNWRSRYSVSSILWYNKLTEIYKQLELLGIIFSFWLHPKTLRIIKAHKKNKFRSIYSLSEDSSLQWLALNTFIPSLTGSSTVLAIMPSCCKFNGKLDVISWDYCLVLFDVYGSSWIEENSYTARPDDYSEKTMRKRQVAPMA